MKIKRMLLIFMLIFGFTNQINATDNEELNGLWEMISSEWEEFLNILGITESNEDTGDDKEINPEKSEKISSPQNDSTSSINPVVKKVIDSALDAAEYMGKETKKRLDKSYPTDPNRNYNLDDYPEETPQINPNNKENDNASNYHEQTATENVVVTKKNDLAKNECVASLRNSHLKFKGVPIDGTLETFVKGMINVGFKLNSMENREANLSGDFAGFKDCEVYVFTLHNKNLVSRILVEFQNQDQWKYLLSDYTELKEMLTEKYGKPSSCIEKCPKNYDGREESDNWKLFYLRSGECKYTSTFSSPKGEVILSMEHGSLYYFVSLIYKDKINSEDVKKHAIEDL